MMCSHLQNLENTQNFLQTWSWMCDADEDERPQTEIVAFNLKEQQSRAELPAQTSGGQTHSWQTWSPRLFSAALPLAAAWYHPVTHTHLCCVRWLLQTLWLNYIPACISHRMLLKCFFSAAAAFPPGLVLVWISPSFALFLLEQSFYLRLTWKKKKANKHQRYRSDTSWYSSLTAPGSGAVVPEGGRSRPLISGCWV